MIEISGFYSQFHLCLTFIITIVSIHGDQACHFSSVVAMSTIYLKFIKRNKLIDHLNITDAISKLWNAQGVKAHRYVEWLFAENLRAFILN